MLSALDHLSVEDQALFLSNGIGPSRAVPFPVVHHAFEHHARSQPHAIAVEHALYRHALTYTELDKQANRLAHRLRAQGARPGHRVCILARRSVYLVIAILAVLKSGAQYVPMDAVTITDLTLDHILRDSSPKLVLVMEEYALRVSGPPSLILEDVIAVDEQADTDATKPEDLSSPSDGLYVIYTSGTTGVPKGVDVRHDGVSNVISDSPGNVGMQPGMRVAQLLNIAFDMGAWEILASLYNGCTLCLRGNTSKDWVALMKTVDVVICTPSILGRHEPTDYPNLKHVIVGGEVCPQALADKWATHTQFNNCCGPTEISICNTVRAHTPGYPLSIGAPIPNTNVYILSRDETPLALPIGEVGSMWVGGIGVSNGYLNLPEQTAARWRLDPFISEGHSSHHNRRMMMFNTGDLACWRPDGQLMHYGRADDQVKIRGFRVELDGVAAALHAYAPVRDAVALLVNGATNGNCDNGGAGTPELWAFVTPRSVDLGHARAAAARVQPYYAVPSRLVGLDVFPVTRNGKVDKRRLYDIAVTVAGAVANPDADPHADPHAVLQAACLPVSFASFPILSPSLSSSSPLPSPLTSSFREGGETSLRSAVVVDVTEQWWTDIGMPPSVSASEASPEKTDQLRPGQEQQQPQQQSQAQQQPQPQEQPQQDALSRMHAIAHYRHLSLTTTSKQWTWLSVSAQS